MRRVLFLGVVLALLASGTAHATVIQGHGKFQRWADQAKAPTTPYVTRVKVGPCPYEQAFDGCYMTNHRIYVRPGTDRWLFWHELGHAFDWTVLKPRHRRRLRFLLDAPGVWRTEPRDSPAERFAEAYAGCAAGANFRVCRVVRRAAKQF